MSKQASPPARDPPKPAAPPVTRGSDGNGPGRYRFMIRSTTSSPSLTS